MSRYILLFALLIALPSAAAAQQAASAYTPARYGRHSLTIQLGLLNWATVDNSVSARDVTTDTRTTGFVGAISYAYWAGPTWAATISVGLLNAETGTSATSAGVTSETAVVLPVLFGVKYAPGLLSRDSSLRPYVSGAVGPYLGVATNSQVGDSVSSETITETALGLRAMAGADWFVSGHVQLGIGVGYHFITDFDEHIGVDKNYSGPEFSIGLGFVFGRSR